MDSKYVTFNGRTLARVRGGEPRPWDNDLVQRFEDPETRQAVSDFMAATVQPYITRLEQDRPPAEAAQLFADFQTDPLGTFKEITEELIEGNVLTPEALAELFAEPAPQNPETPAPEGLTPEQVRSALEGLGLDPEQVKAATESTLNKDANEQYDAAVAEIVEANPEFFKHPQDADKDVRGWIDSHIYAADGDVEAGLEGYKAWYTECFGDPNAEAPADPPPATVGKEGAAAETPTEKRYTGDDGLDNAIDDFFAEQRAADPPAVGSV